jgi:hypothetical protein
VAKKTKRPIRSIQQVYLKFGTARTVEEALHLALVRDTSSRFTNSRTRNLLQAFPYGVQHDISRLVVCDPSACFCLRHSVNEVSWRWPLHGILFGKVNAVALKYVVCQWWWIGMVFERESWLLVDWETPWQVKGDENPSLAFVPRPGSVEFYVALRHCFQHRHALAPSTVNLDDSLQRNVWLYSCCQSL